MECVASFYICILAIGILMLTYLRAFHCCKTMWDLQQTVSSHCLWTQGLVGDVAMTGGEWRSPAKLSPQLLGQDTQVLLDVYGLWKLFLKTRSYFIAGLDSLCSPCLALKSWHSPTSDSQEPGLQPWAIMVDFEIPHSLKLLAESWFIIWASL